MSTSAHDRRVEITGPTDRKMVIKGPYSGAGCATEEKRDE
jgi:hypothetical protein